MFLNACVVQDGAMPETYLCVWWKMASDLELAFVCRCGVRWRQACDWRVCGTKLRQDYDLCVCVCGTRLRQVWDWYLHVRVARQWADVLCGAKWHYTRNWSVWVVLEGDRSVTDLCVVVDDVRTEPDWHV